MFVLRDVPLRNLIYEAGFKPVAGYAYVPFDAGKMIRLGKGRLHRHPYERKSHYDAYDPTRGPVSAVKHAAVDYVWKLQVKERYYRHQVQQAEANLKQLRRGMKRQDLDSAKRRKIKTAIGIWTKVHKNYSSKLKRMWKAPIRR